MTNEQALQEIRGRIEKTRESAEALGLAPEFWQPQVEVLRKAEESLTYYILVQSQKLPSYAEFCGRQSRIGRKLDWIREHMAEAEIDEMLEVYHEERIERLMGEEAHA